jgi:hypothetical protein
MKQYKITSDNIAPIDEQDDCSLPADDPAHEIKRLQFLGGLGGEERLAEYRSKQLTTENITHTAAENARIMREKNIRPGTPEWFQLWFSLPYLTGEPKNNK